MIVVDPPEPSPSPRVYERGWSPTYWRGSLDEIVGAAQAALEEIKRQHPDEEAIGESVHLDFADKSKQDLGSLAGLRDALPNIDIKEVQGFWISFTVLGKVTASVRIKASESQIDVNASGSEAFAAGMVATLKSRLAGGAEAGEQAASVPMRVVDWVLLGLIPVAFIGAQVFCYAQFSHDDPVWFLFLGLVAALIPGMIAGFVVPDALESRRPPGFVVVPEGKQFRDEGEAGEGPVWRAKAWFDRHPLVKFVLTLIIGGLIGALVAQGVGGLLS